MQQLMSEIFPTGEGGDEERTTTKTNLKERNQKNHTFKSTETVSANMKMETSHIHYVINIMI